MLLGSQKHFQNSFALSRSSQTRFLYMIEKNLFLYLHSSHHKKISRLTETLKSMKSDGSYDAIMAEYDVENQ